MNAPSRSSDPTAPDYVLLQQHQFALVGAEHEELLDREVLRTRLVPNEFIDSATLMPSLVNLNLLDQTKRQALIDNLLHAFATRTAPLCSALLATNAGERLIEAHLAAAQLRTARDGRRAWLRVHDPRVWIQLPRILNPGGIRKLFGPITAWTISSHGRWTSTTPPGDSVVQRKTTEQTDAAVWAALERIGSVNRVLAQCRWGDFESSVEHGAAIDALLVRGQQRHGLTRQDDLVEYATMGVRVHPRFDEHPLALAAIQSEQADAASLALDSESNGSCVVDALRSISQSNWERARAELCS